LRTFIHKKKACGKKKQRREGKKGGPHETKKKCPDLMFLPYRNDPFSSPKICPFFKGYFLLGFQRVPKPKKWDSRFFEIRANTVPDFMPHGFTLAFQTFPSQHSAPPFAHFYFIIFRSPHYTALHFIVLRSGLARSRTSEHITQTRSPPFCTTDLLRHY
jgi:hypothetical protein